MTFVPFPDVTAGSENGEYRIEIRGTQEDDLFRDQSHFKYQLYRSNQLVWERLARPEGDDQESLSDHPHEAWVNDDGWVVVREHTWFTAGLFVLNPSGKVVLSRYHRSIDDKGAPGFLDDEPANYMGDSSAGPFWSRCSIAYFFDHKRQPFWAIRTWWGRRVIIDLLNGEFVASETIDEQQARSVEIAHTQKTLAGHIEKLEAFDQLPDEEKDRREFWSLAIPMITAAYHAGWLKSEESIPYLRRLETLRSDGGHGFGPVCWAILINLPFREVAKLSLLRLDHEPRWLSHYEFKIDSEECEEELFQFPMQVEDRNPDDLNEGMTQKEALLRVGAPDYISRKEWEYDFFSEESRFTIRILWDDSHLENLPNEERKEKREKYPARIGRIQMLSPQWEKITMRDHHIT